MDRERQKKAPIYEALEAFKKKRVVPFDVPGHKRGRGNPELVQLLGEKCVSLDVNSMKPLDNLCHPVSVIREAEELAAEAFGAASAYLMVGGTTSAVQSMILSVVKAGDKIILPRNVHKSVINALVLCGGIPIYVNPEMNQRLGISLGMQVEKVKQAIEDNPDAVAVFVNNPTYYGICSDIKTIVQLAHARGMRVLADEAHGTHLYFGKNLPISAMAAGADMAAVSMHKSGGSLTQSSLLLLNKGVNTDYVRQIINLTQTTSASYLLLSSLDISRRNLALRGEESFAKVVEMAEYARREINSIGGYYAYGKELVKDAEEILNAYLRMEERAACLRTEEKTVRIGTVYPLAPGRIPQMLREFRATFPFIIYNRMTPEIAEGLLEGKYDIGFCSDLLKSEELEYYPIQASYISVVLPQGHPLGNRKNVTLKEAARYPQIMFSKTSGFCNLQEQIFAEEGIQVRPVCAAEELEVITGLVEQGFGISVLPYMDIVRLHNVVTIPLQTSVWKSKFYIARRKYAVRSEQEDAFFQYWRKEHGEAIEK